jgi:hypothetical protein
MGCLCAKNTKEEGGRNQHTQTDFYLKTLSYYLRWRQLLQTKDGDLTMYVSQIDDVPSSDPSLRLIVKVATMNANSAEVQVKSGTSVAELKRALQQTAEFFSEDFG